MTTVNLPPDEPCRTCGAKGTKQWTMLEGQQVCDECWLEVASDIQYHKFHEAKENLAKVRKGTEIGAREQVRTMWKVPRRAFSCASVSKPAASTPHQGRTNTPGIALREDESSRALSSLPRGSRPSEGTLGTLQEPRLVPIRARGGSEIQATSLTPSRLGANPATTQDWHRRGSHNKPNTRRSLWLKEVIKPTQDSHCLICGHIFYGAAMSSCSRCGGRCKVYNSEDLALMGRRATALVESKV